MKTTQYPKILAAAILLAVLGATTHADTLFPTGDTYSTVTLKGKPPVVTKTSLASATGASPYLEISETHTSYIQFGAGTALAGTSVSRAILTLWFYSVAKPGALEVDLATSAWQEKFTGPDTVEPGYNSSTPAATISAGSVVAKQFVSVDVTAAVQAWVANPATDFGFAIATPDNIASVILSSKEGTTIGYPAMLEVDVTDGTAPTYGTTGTFTGAVTAGDFSLPVTTTAGEGVIMQGGASLIQTFGSENFFAGNGAGNFSMTGGNSVGIGANALAANTTGAGLTAIGEAALNVNTIGFRNTALGVFALTSNTAGSTNTATGALTLHDNTIGSANVANGSYALQKNTTADQNVAVGYNALNIQSYSNSGVEWSSNNVALGFQALYANQPTSTSNGINNTAVGTNALFQNITGTNNIAVGNFAGRNLTTESNNIDIGHQGAAGDSGIIRIGDGETQTDIYLTGVIHGEGLNLPTTDNSGIAGVITQGGIPLIQTFGGNNFFAGSGAGNFVLSGSNNVGIGASALAADTTGFGLTAIGYNALTANIGGYHNTAIGDAALSANTTGAHNTASGASALSANTIGGSNTASGFDALQNNSTADQNVAIGYGALATQSFPNGGTEWPSSNVAVGYQALNLNQPTAPANGINNTAVGTNALSTNATGSSNIGIGAGAGGAVTTGNNNIEIGSTGVAGDNNTIRIGQVTSGTSAQTAAFIAGIDGVTTSDSGSTVAVMIDKNGNLGTVKSSRRYKEEIADMGDVSARLEKLRPVTFRYKKPYANGEKPVQFGLIAEEVAEVFPELAVLNDHGQPETVKYQDLTPLLLNEFLKEHRQVEEQKATIAEQTKQIQAMAGRLEEMESLLRQVKEHLDAGKPASAF